MKQWIDQIASKALAPEEWRAFPETVIRPATVTPETQRLMVRWEKILLLSTNNYSIFDKRLQSLGLDRNSALEYLGDRTLPTTANLPSWAELLTKVLTASNFEQPIVPPEQLRAYSDTELEVLSLDLTRKPSFPEFLHPFISVTLRRIAQKLKPLQQLTPMGWDGKRESRLLVSSPVKDNSESLLGLEIITNTAVEQVARYLLFKLSDLSARTVAYEVKQWQARGTLIGETPNSRYRYFVEKILGTPEGQQELFSKYPVLARLLAACCEQVSVITVELLERLCRDWAKLSVYFDTGSCLGQLTSLLMGLSDPHQGGRTVCCLEFASGLKLIYKPRDLAIDVAFNHLVTWLNETGEMPALRLTRILPRQGYGWSEFISYRECTTTAEVANFYQRQGIYAALFYFLCGVDFHAGNFIAHGECPVPIDLEGILSPGLHVMSENSSPIPPGYRPLSFSVLTTGMLPNWRAGDSDRVLFVTSGISGNGDRELPWKEPVWEGLESDRLSLVRAYRSSHPNKNLPRLAAKTVPVNDYLDQVVRGFTLGYQTLLRHRDELLAPKSPLTAFQTVTSRCLLRDTKDYHDLLFWSTAPDQLTSGAAYNVALERLCSNLSKLGIHEFAFTTKDENLSVSVSPCPRVSASIFKTRLDVSLVDDEKRCLWQRDIPIYYGTPSERSLSASNGNVYENAFEQPSYIQMKQRFQEASQEDLHWQLEVLNASFQMSFQPKGSPLQLNPDEEGLKARLLAHAVAIGDVLERLALCDRRGNSWLTLYRVSKMSRAVEYAIADPWLYSGTAGIAVFLANLAAYTGERRYEELARGALNYSESVIRWWVERGEEIALSGYNGIFSVVYALTECGRCLKDESLIERAINHALAISREQLCKQDNPDVLSGAAGALLVLLHLNPLHPHKRLIEQAVLLAQGIIGCQAPGTFDRGWKVPGFKRPLLGMGHGAAGIAYALLGLYVVTGEDWLRVAASSGLNYERQYFCTQARDWPNLQSEFSKPHFMTGWCAGAPGIGLARLGMLEILDGEAEIREEINIAIEATIRHLGRYSIQHLCCGEAGRLLFLSEASLRNSRPELLQIARQAGLKLLDSYEREGHWYLQQFPERAIVPGLMGGVAGIGLMLLGLLAPETTSRVLLLK